MSQDSLGCEVEDTYAEGFRSIYAEILITCRDRKWLQHCVRFPTLGAAEFQVDLKRG